MENQDYQTALEDFILNWEAMKIHTHEEICEKNDYNPDNLRDKHCTITYTRGRKFDKLICDNSVIGFVERNSGDLYMAASWSAPAKHVRGNIFKENTMDSVTAYGVKYLR